MAYLGATKVFVIDDDHAMREVLSTVLASIGLEVECFADGETFLGEFDHDGPGCIITDYRMPGMLGTELIRDCARCGVALPVIVISGFADIDLVIEAFRAGACDFLQKPFSNTALITAVRRALDISGRAAAAARRESILAQEMARLTPREREIAPFLTQGLTSKEIGLETGISYRTIERHRVNILKKFGCRNVAELAALLSPTPPAPAPRAEKSAKVTSILVARRGVA
jgi:FixJ family two-component response regulator